MRHQVVQHGKDFGRQRNGLGLTPQAGVVRVQPKAIKEPLGRGGHGMSSRVLIVSIGQQLPDYCNIYDTFPRRVWLPLQHLLSAVPPTTAIAPGIYRIIAGRRQGSKKRSERDIERYAREDG